MIPKPALPNDPKLSSHEEVNREMGLPVGYLSLNQVFPQYSDFSINIFGPMPLSLFFNTHANNAIYVHYVCTTAMLCFP
jgi:hypothetical protein